WRGRADGRVSCHYGLHMTIKDWNEAVRGELAEMTAAGVTSYKIYLAYPDLRVSDAAACQIVKAVEGQGGIVGCHCENGDLVAEGIAAMKAQGRLGPEGHPASRPPLVEAEAVDRWLAIAELAGGAPVNVVHLSTRRGLEAVRAARARGQKIYVETCPQYLLLDEGQYRLPGFEGAKFVLSPPLRSPEDQAALWEALESGEIDTVGTDHCAFDFHGGKTLGRGDFSKIPNGIPGVEHRAALLYTYGVAAGRISLVRFMKLLAEQPARLFGMYPQKGTLAVGSDADIVVFDPYVTNRISARSQHQNVDYTPYEGLLCSGRVDTVLLEGQVVMEAGRVLRERAGRYVPRGPCGFWR
ncbi:MAG: dihydropyrimidinase, partial [Clostridiales bacterium]|nr:dihydropyrimidinase [Clostridiales bacterium]